MTPESLINELAERLGVEAKEILSSDRYLFRSLILEIRLKLNFEQSMRKFTATITN